jgi:hypothetical protein
VRAKRVAIAVGAGTALGVASFAGLRLGGAWLSNLGGVWFATAFAVAAGCRRLRDGVGLATLTLVAGTIAYYALRVAGGSQGVPERMTFWLLVAALGGPAFGVAGVLWRTQGARVRLAAMALLSGTLAGEALAAMVAWRDPSHELAASLQLAAAAAIATAAAARESRAAELIAVAALVVPAAFVARAAISMTTYAL